LGMITLVDEWLKDYSVDVNRNTNSA